MRGFPEPYTLTLAGAHGFQPAKVRVPLNTTITGGGTLALGGFTMTVPATGTALVAASAMAAGSLPYGGLTAVASTLAIGANPSVLLCNGAAPSWGLLLDSHIDPAAAITWTKVSKTGSSLGDLDTRSATDLSSGSLADARLSANVALYNGSTAFSALQKIDLGSGSAGSTATGTHLQLFAADTANLSLSAATFGNANGANFYSYNVGGTRASQSGTADASAFWNFAARGHNGTALTGTKASFNCTADGAWTGSNNGAYWQFGGTPNGSTTFAYWVLFRNASLILQSGVTLQLGNAYVAGAPAATGYVTIKDSSGTTYKVLVST